MGRGLCRSCGAVCGAASIRGREGPNGSPKASQRLIMSGGGGRTAGVCRGGIKRRSRSRNLGARCGASGCRSARVVLVCCRGGGVGSCRRAAGAPVCGRVQPQVGAVLATGSIGRAITTHLRRCRCHRRRVASCVTGLATCEGRCALSRSPTKLAFRSPSRVVSCCGRSQHRRLRRGGRKNGRRRACWAISAIRGVASGRRVTTVSGRCRDGLRVRCSGRALTRGAVVVRGSPNCLLHRRCSRSVAGRRRRYLRVAAGSAKRSRKVTRCLCTKRQPVLPSIGH